MIAASVDAAVRSGYVEIAVPSVDRIVVQPNVPEHACAQDKLNRSAP